MSFIEKDVWKLRSGLYKTIGRLDELSKRVEWMQTRIERLAKEIKELKDKENDG